MCSNFATAHILKLLILRGKKNPHSHTGAAQLLSTQQEFIVCPPIHTNERPAIAFRLRKFIYIRKHLTNAKLFPNNTGSRLNSNLLFAHRKRFPHTLTHTRALTLFRLDNNNKIKHGKKSWHHTHSQLSSFWKIYTIATTRLNPPKRVESGCENS